AGELSIRALMNWAAARGEFVPPSPYPAVSRDLAPRVPSQIPYADVKQAVDAVSIPFLEQVTLTDVFTGAPLPEGMKSMTLNFTFRSSEGTLTDDQINQALAQIRKSLEEACGATFVG